MCGLSAQLGCEGWFAASGSLKPGALVCSNLSNAHAATRLQQTD